MRVCPTTKTQFTQCVRFCTFVIRMSSKDCNRHSIQLEEQAQLIAPERKVFRAQAKTRTRLASAPS